MIVLQLDWDGRYYARKYQRMRAVLRMLYVTPRFVRLDRTRRGWHCWVGLGQPNFAQGDADTARLFVVALQALMGDDWKRGVFNFRRVWALRFMQGKALQFWGNRWNVLYAKHDRHVKLTPGPRPLAPDSRRRAPKPSYSKARGISRTARAGKRVSARSP